MMSYEINHKFSTHDSAFNFIYIPVVYLVLTIMLDILLRKFKSLNRLTIVLMVLQLLVAVTDAALRSYKFTEWLSFIVFAVNVVLFQKLVFVHVAVTLVRIFEINNVHVCNYLNGQLISHAELNPVPH